MEQGQIFRIAAIPGDGVGAEVVAAGQQVLESMAEASAGKFSIEWISFPWGSAYYAAHGVMMDPKGLEMLQDTDAIYFGAVGWENVQDHTSLWASSCPGSSHPLGVRIRPSWTG